MFKGTLYNILKAKISNPRGKNQSQVSGQNVHQADSQQTQLSPREVSGQSDLGENRT
jgi:hypothetical protein